MNAFAKHALAAIALSAALVAAPASAMTSDSLYNDVQSAVSDGRIVNVSVSNGVATLTGNTDALSRAAAARVAAAHPDVERVVNLIDAS